MHPLDIQETDRSGTPVEGLLPAATLGSHASLALEMLRGWLRARRHGKIIRTRTGGRRVMPASVRLLARQYVYDRIDETHFRTPIARHYARRYYTYALEVSIGAKLEDLAAIMLTSEGAYRSRARPWQHVIKQLRLDETPSRQRDHGGPP